MLFGREGSYWIVALPGETEGEKNDKSENNKFPGVDSKTALRNTCSERYSFTSMVGETV